jgi:hypothetical protein
MAFALHIAPSMLTIQTIDIASLELVTGGAAAAPQQDQDEAPQGRSWGQVGREYAAACVTGAGQALLYGGRPRNVKDGAITAAMGCAMGVGMKAVEDFSGRIAGQ